MPAALLEHCPPGARIVNTAPLSLDEIIAEIAAGHAAGHDVARLQPRPPDLRGGGDEE